MPIVASFIRSYKAAGIRTDYENTGLGDLCEELDFKPNGCSH